MSDRAIIPRLSRAAGALLLLAAVAACARPEATGDIHDPYEERNREVFQANLAFDRAVFGRAGEGEGDGIPVPVRRGLSNLSDTVSLPQTLVNDLLQLNIHDAVHNSFRLAVNLTFGLGGLLDPATEMGIESRPSDFGETLYVWGVGEGAYLVLPVLGPSTERAAVGKVVDVFTNPLTYVIPAPERYGIPGLRVVGTALSRGEFASTVESVLYDSADPYGQVRVIYLENRRFTLQGGRGDTQDEFIDPYEDLYGE